MKSFKMFSVLALFSLIGLSESPALGMFSRRMHPLVTRAAMLGTSQPTRSFSWLSFFGKKSATNFNDLSEHEQGVITREAWWANEVWHQKKNAEQEKKACTMVGLCPIYKLMELGMLPIKNPSLSDDELRTHKKTLIEDLWTIAMEKTTFKNKFEKKGTRNCFGEQVWRANCNLMGDEMGDDWAKEEDATSKQQRHQEILAEYREGYRSVKVHDNALYGNIFGNTHWSSSCDYSVSPLRIRRVNEQLQQERNAETIPKK